MYSSYSNRWNPEVAAIDAATQGHADRLKDILAANLNLIAKENWGNLALQGAIVNNHPECVGTLLDRGASCEEENVSGWRPLMLAAINGHAEVVKALLTKSPDVAAVTIKENWTALTVAAANNQVTVINPFHAAGADLEVGDARGRTALMQASLHGHEAAAEALLNAGAKVDRTDREGYTSLMFAAEENQAATVRLLLARGAQINATDIHHHTALLLTIPQGHVDMAQLLLERGADVDISDQDGKIATSSANGNDDMVQLVKMWKARAMQTSPERSPGLLPEPASSPQTSPPENCHHDSRIQKSTDLEHPQITHITVDSDEETFFDSRSQWSPSPLL